ncbi:hypothetical protein PGTUg99_011173 [Puccinia graminis f. sp. tritici]|uniref:Uncharacterized protein n=1 Tax=Puccinia graminis f. sp. tritici TaxID=56615 RepID=A0A5B0NRD6_PUCGR|nr:hypothetical protein PGTUg99_011173 [Puccinia graminis f. sp. tritici]
MGVAHPDIRSDSDIRTPFQRNWTSASASASSGGYPLALAGIRADIRRYPPPFKEKKVNWEQVIKLIHGYQQTRKTEAWLLGTSFNPTVCSNVYSNICKTYLEKDLGQLESFDASQALDVARRLYKVHLKSIA